MTLTAPTSLFHKRNPIHGFQKKILGRRYPIAATKGKQADKLGETIDDLASTASPSSDDDIHSLPPDEEQEAARLEWRAYHLQSGEIDEALGLSVTGEEEEEVNKAVAKLEAARLEWRAHHLETGAYGEALDLSLSAEEREEVERSMPPQPTSTFHDYLTDKAGHLDKGWRTDAPLALSPTKAEEDLAAIGAKIERSDDLYMKNEFVQLLYPDGPTSGPLQLLELKVNRSKQWLPSPQLLFMQAVVGLGAPVRQRGHDLRVHRGPRAREEPPLPLPARGDTGQGLQAGPRRRGLRLAEPGGRCRRLQRLSMRLLYRPLAAPLPASHRAVRLVDH